MGRTKVTEQDLRLAKAALQRALEYRIPDVEAVAEAIADAREEGWRAAVDRLTDAGLRAALTRGHR